MHVLVGSLTERNVRNPDAVLEVTRNVLRRAGARGFEICVVIPDEASRIAFITVESLSGSSQDRETFVRWKLRKSVPFDIDSAQIAYHVLGAHAGAEGKGIDIMVVLSPRAIVQEYEGLLEKLDIHAGYVIPSSVAAMNLHPAAAPASAAEDVLLVKIGPDSIATTVFQNHRPRFYRRVPEMSIYDAVYPTIMYYQDKLHGTALASATICGYDKDVRSEIEELETKFGVPVRRMEPSATEDIFKPALGAAGLV